MRKITDVLITQTLLLSLNARVRKIEAFESLAKKSEACDPLNSRYVIYRFGFTTSKAGYHEN